MLRRRSMWFMCILALAACSAPVTPPAIAPKATAAHPALPTPSGPLPEVELNNYGPAPELTNDVWLNVDQPLRLADLRGRVVLIDMWTFG